MAVASIGVFAPRFYGTRKEWCFSSSAVMGSSLKLSQELGDCPCRLAHKSSIVAALRTSGGFGKRPEAKAKPKILKELEVNKVESTDTYKIFARKVAGEEAQSKWESIGEILIESGASVEVALKERKNFLAAGVKYQHPVLVILEKGEAVEYGVQLAPPKDAKDAKEEATKGGDEKEAPEITVVDLGGKQPEETVPAILRVDDGKSPGKTRKF
ncbi:uncharacterized protein LOC112345366 [Selaginella moellendorffii]|uniref:uncharacterized protein LOC112345366 n=1 Tax=Selaginella moellendorffii TaxID=88036 RepID=UPI000D1CDBDB|nr:uncharacterized protein LOC112345366 [Selaginella moellendorffii]|eukprot:XP_024527710.1 uncharacterized protein LOC112345366 [Selaginella moellendorffii]